MLPDSQHLGTPLAYALAYAQIGWHVLPLEPRTKVPLGKLVPRGMLDASTDIETLRSWWARCPDAGIGIALSRSGLVAIDIDPRNGGTETFDQLQAAHGKLTSDVMAYTGGGGEHHVFIVPQAAQISLPGTLGPGVDLKANGYIVVEPSFHPSGKQYGWEASSSPLDGIVPSPLPDWLRSLRVELQRPQPRPGDVPVDVPRAKDAREALYTLDPDDYHEWVQAGMALHSTGWGHPAYAIWCGWAQQSDKFDATDSRRKWESFSEPQERGNAKSVSLSWIFGKAQSLGWVNPASSGHVISFSASTPEEASELVLTVAQLYERAQAVEWAVKGLIPERGLGFFFGASGTFKSFIALDYALHRQYGMQWLGRRTKQANVVYLAAEGGAGLIRRIQAWHKARKLDWKECGLRVVIVPLTLRTQAAELRAAITQVCDQVGDLIVDTMSQTFSGNENDNAEVAEWLRIIGIELRDGLKCTVSVVHHTGHAATERPRGASAILANSDFAFGIFRDEKQMLATIEFMKVKDAERPEDQTFDLTSHELGFDGDGDPITSLTATHIASADDMLESMRREGSMGRGGNNNLLMGLLQNGMMEKELRLLFYKECDAKDSDAKRQAYHRARKWATGSGLIEVADGRIIMLKGAA
jgi:hypothetical protein